VLVDELGGQLDAVLDFGAGVSSASEIMAARREGLFWTKALPASVLGADWVKAQRGPFPDQRFVATGGMTAHTVSAFLAAGTRVVARGAAFDDPEENRLVEDLLRS